MFLFYFLRGFFVISSFFPLITYHICMRSGSKYSGSEIIQSSFLFLKNVEQKTVIILKPKLDTTCTQFCECDRANYASVYYVHVQVHEFFLFFFYFHYFIRLLIQTLHLISVNCFFTCHSCVFCFLTSCFSLILSLSRSPSSCVFFGVYNSWCDWLIDYYVSRERLYTFQESSSQSRRFVFSSFVC